MQKRREDSQTFTYTFNQSILSIIRMFIFPSFSFLSPHNEKQKFNDCMQLNQTFIFLTNLGEVEVEKIK